MIEINLRTDKKRYETQIALTLPASKWDVLTTAAQLGTSNFNDCYMRIDTINDESGFAEYLDKLVEGDNFFNELNCFMHRISELSDTNRLLLHGALAIHEPQEMKTLINLTYHLDDIVVGEAGSLKELGQFLIDNGHLDFPDEVIPLLDLEKVGEQHIADHACALDRNLFYEDLNPDIEEVYDGHTLPEYGAKHVFKVSLRNPQQEPNEMLMRDLHLPMHYDDIEIELQTLGLDFMEDADVVDYKSSIARLEDMTIPPGYLRKLNNLAIRISEISDADYIKLVAVAEHEKVFQREDTLDRLHELSRSLDNYDFAPAIRPRDVGRYGLVIATEQEQTMSQSDNISHHYTEYYSDGSGVLNEQAEYDVPQKVLQWFEEVISNNPARNMLTYLAKHQGVFGIMAVGEYDVAYLESQREIIREKLQRKADTLADNPLFENCRVSTVRGIGDCSSDDLSVFIPASTEPAQVREIIGAVERIAYSDLEQTAEPLQELEMGGLV